MSEVKLPAVIWSQM